MRKLKVLVRYEHGGCRTPFGAAYIRLLRPLSHPSIAEAFDLVVGDEPSCRGMDVVIADRLWKPGATTREAMQLVEQARRAGACLIYAIDDNLLDLNEISIEQKAVVGLLARGRRPDRVDGRVERPFPADQPDHRGRTQRDRRTAVRPGPRAAQTSWNKN